MWDIASVILPVFIVIGLGYVAAWRGLLSPPQVDGLMKFAQGVAIPIMLMRAMSRIDLAAGFDPRFILSFYGGATAGFAIGMLVARYVFRRDWEDAVAIGFVGLFSNSLLLGLAMTERAYGAESLSANFAIIAIHSPYCYALGITVMEVVRARQSGGSLIGLPAKVLRGMFKNGLIIGITVGMAVNVSGLTLPETLTAGLDLVASAGIPAALFGLGGVLLRYRPEGDMRIILFIVAVSLLLHPAVTYGLARWFDLPVGALRSAVVTAGMAPGVNAYLFADMYGRARRVAASAVLLGTLGSIATAAFWIAILP